MLEEEITLLEIVVGRAGRQYIKIDAEFVSMLRRFHVPWSQIRKDLGVSETEFRQWRIVVAIVDPAPFATTASLLNSMQW